MVWKSKIISHVNIFADNQRFFFGEVVYPAGGRLGPRRQSNVQMVIVHRGEAVITVEGCLRRVGARQATVLLPGRTEHFLFSQRGRTHHTWCEAIEPILSTEAIAWFDRLPEVFPWTIRRQQLLRLGLSAQKEMDDTPPDLRDLIARTLFCEVRQGEVPRPVGGAAQHPAVERACRWIHEHLAGAFTIEELARAAGLSPQHLTRLFRLHLGVTPVAHAWRMRTERGARLLIETGLTVKEVADRSGFLTPFHFSRSMRRHFGLPPREWRRQGWGQTKPDPASPARK